MDYEAQVSASLNVTGVFEFHDAEGNLVGTTEVSGSIPLTDGAQVDEARALTNTQGAHDGQLRE